MSRRRSLLCSAILAVTIPTAFACSHGAVASAVTAASAIEPAAPSLSDDVARGMVEKISEQVAQIRGLAFKQAVPVRVVNDAEMREYMLGRLDAFDQRAHLERTGEVYSLLGLIPPDTDLLALLLDALEEQVGGFYDPTEGVYFLMDDIAGASAPIYTAHELTHALEDQHYDLDSRIRSAIDDDDHSLAVGAVHEGSATLLMSAYTVGAMQRGELDAQALLEISQAESGKMQQFRQMPEVLQRQLLAPYLLGALFLTKGNLTAAAMSFPAAELARVMEAGPTSSEQILHPEKFWDELDPPLSVALPPLGALLGSEWTLSGEGVIGELSIGPMVGAATPLSATAMGAPRAADWTNDAAAGWGGDRWQLWRSGESAAVAWLTLWDSARDAEQFADALAQRTSLAHRRLGKRVAVVAGKRVPLEEELLGRLLE